MNSLLSDIHHTLAGKSLGGEGADIVVRNLFHTIELVSSRYEPQNEEWELDVLNALRLCDGVKMGSTSAQVYLLSIIEDRWDDMSISFRKRYDFQYAVLVVRETGVQPSTMDNYTRAAKVFFGEAGKRPLGRVEVTKYDEYRQPVKVDGEYVKEYQEFDPTKVPISKLAVAAPLAKQDKMTAKLWDMLADNQITVEALNREIHKLQGSDTESDGDPSLRFTLEANRLVAHEFGEHVEIGELYFDNADGELARSAIRRLLLLLQIPHEADVISRMIQAARETQLVRIYENGGDILLKE